MYKDFAPYNEALALKDLDFDERCFLCYSKEGELSNAMTLDKNELNNIGFVLAPTFSQAFRFFRESHGLCGFVMPFGEDLFDYRIYSAAEGDHLYGSPEYETYEHAELACLQKLITIVKKS